MQSSANQASRRGLLRPQTLQLSLHLVNLMFLWVPICPERPRFHRAKLLINFKRRRLLKHPILTDCLRRVLDQSPLPLRGARFVFRASKDVVYSSFKHLVPRADLPAGGRQRPGKTNFGSMDTVYNPKWVSNTTKCPTLSVTCLVLSGTSKVVYPHASGLTQGSNLEGTGGVLT